MFNLSPIVPGETALAFYTVKVREEIDLIYILYIFKQSQIHTLTLIYYLNNTYTHTHILIYYINKLFWK